MKVLRFVTSSVCVLGLSSLALPSAAAADVGSSSPPNCQGSFDPYAYTPSALASCGIQTYPATITALPGGGELYTYQGANGVFAQTTMPPAGFDAVNASDAELAEYGYPPRPSDPAAYEQWQRMVSIPRSTPEPFMADTTGFSATDYNTHWGGYITNNGGFDYVEMEYTEPSYDNAACSNDAEVTWTGIGGGPGATGILVQDGTAHGTDLQNHQPWWEIATSGSGSLHAFSQDGTVNNGDDILVTTDLQSYPGSVVFNVYDYTQNKTWSTTKSLNGQSPSPATAEIIVERPYNTTTQSYPPLSKFGTLDVPYAAAAQGGLAYDFGSYAHTAIHMTRSGSSDGVPLATPDPNYIWNVNWNHCI